MPSRPPTQRLPAMDETRQTIVGMSLALAINAVWLAAHVYGVFLLDRSTASYPAMAALVALSTWLSVGLFIIAHDAMHGSLAPYRPGVNAFMGQLALGLYAGFRFAPLNREHHLHHRFAGTADDPDFDERPPHGFWAWYAAFMQHYFGLREFAVLALLVAAYSLVLGADMGNLLLFWALPALASSLQLFIFGTYLPHRPGTDTFNDRHRTRSNDMPVWLSLLTCFHFGYHHEHHDQPAVPWWRLPAARAVVRQA